MNNYYTTIGLEVHAQLLTKTKMFCSCRAAYGEAPNTNTCPICLGLPGALPYPNRTALTMAVMIGKATDCQIAVHTKFDRKNYFYPDLPKGYQISQFDQPLCEKGRITIRGDFGEKSIRITRIHLEEDAGKSIHDQGDVTLVDLNRCGTPLIEIVSEPDLTSPAEAGAYLNEIRRLVSWLGICDGNMEEGSLRCDANISVAKIGEGKGTPIEIKNMNTISGVEKAIAFEVNRQISELENGGVISRETRLWDAVRNETKVMRTKEQAHDYRYFPEPDLIEVETSPFMTGEYAPAEIELPWERESRYVNELAIKPYDAGVLCSEKSISDYFETVVNEVAEDVSRVVRFVTGEVMRWRKELGNSEDFIVPPSVTADILRYEIEGKLSYSAAKIVYEHIVKNRTFDVSAVVNELGLLQVSDESAIQNMVEQVIHNSPKEVERYANGEKKLFGFFVGQMMKISGGKVDPVLANRLMKERLER